MTDKRTSEPTHEQVETAARAIWERYAGHGLWETLPPVRKAPFLKDARASLVAAQGAAPVLPSSTVDEDALAEVLCREMDGETYEGEPCSACRQQARAVAEWIDASTTRKEQGR